ncbi:MAG: hypothetical protein LBL87_04050 [Ruminococcus sp.]|jgi:hypothetical protein|nr:hypothetical protein [Ruminococcus sp.]
MRFFLTDIRRALTERTFIVSVLIAFATLFGAFVYLGMSGGDNSFVKTQSLVFPFVAPFFAALPFSAVIMTEKKTKYRDLIKLRRRGKNYILPRFFTVGIAGGFALLLPELFLLLITFLSDIPYTDCLKIITLAFPFGFAYAVLSFSLTFFNDEIILPLIIPQVLYLLLTYAFPYLDLERFYPPLCISPYIFGEPDFMRIGAALCVTVLAAIIITLIGSVREALQYV